MKIVAYIFLDKTFFREIQIIFDTPLHRWASIKFSHTPSSLNTDVPISFHTRAIISPQWTYYSWDKLNILFVMKNYVTWRSIYPKSHLELCLQDFFRPVNLLSELQFSDVNIEFGTELEQTAADEEVDNINSDPLNDGDDVEPMG